MSTFFHGGQRKTGCVLLVIAIGLMAAWLRSHVMIDAGLFMIASVQHEIVSMGGCVYWWSWDAPLHTWGIYSNEFPVQEMQFSQLGELRLRPSENGVAIWIVT